MLMRLNRTSSLHVPMQKNIMGIGITIEPLEGKFRMSQGKRLGNVRRD